MGCGGGAAGYGEESVVCGVRGGVAAGEEVGAGTADGVFDDLKGERGLVVGLVDLRRFCRGIVSLG